MAGRIPSPRTIQQLTSDHTGVVEMTRQQMQGMTYLDKRRQAKDWFNTSPLLLYRYIDLSLGDLLSEKKARDIVIESQFWLSSRDALNDPLDLTAKYVYAGTIEQKRKRIAAMLDENEPGLGWVEKKKKINKWMADPERLNRLGSRALHTTLGMVGICCFSTSARNQHLWTHYAKAHTGLAFVFDIAESLEFFCLAHEVSYSDQQPEFDWVNRPSQVIDVLKAKSLAHAHEQEWRVVRMFHSPPMEAFSPKALKGIIFGMSCKPDTVDWVRRLLEERELKYGAGHDDLLPDLVRNTFRVCG